MDKTKPDYCTCGACGYTWDYNQNPTPANRCPREADHDSPEEESAYEHGWTVVECYPNEKGADAIFRAHGVWRTEEEALDYLAECRDDDGAADGDAWTTVRIRVAY